MHKSPCLPVPQEAAGGSGHCLYLMWCYVGDQKGQQIFPTSLSSVPIILKENAIWSQHAFEHLIISLCWGGDRDMLGKSPITSPTFVF